jgi:putative effector of murein hydrolase LrgA (UPF0299 family)
MNDNDKTRALERQLRELITWALIALFVLLVLADLVDDLFMGNRYTIPGPVFGLVALLIGAVFGVEGIVNLFKSH